MNRSTAYLLISHGSRDPRPHQAVDTLAHALWERLSRQMVQKPQSRRAPLPPAAPTPVVGTAVLELGTLPLHEQIVQFARRAAGAGHRTVHLLPLFLLPGVHVMEDLPTQVAIAQQQLQDAIELQFMPHIGANPNLGALVQFSHDPTTARVLLAHGTKRADGNLPVEAIAAQHRATPAYWAIEPGLGDCLQTLHQAGHRHIEIQPYFLFPGGITDAIAQQIEQLSQELETSQIRLLAPLGMTPALVDVVAQMAIDPTAIAAR